MVKVKLREHTHNFFVSITAEKFLPAKGPNSQIEATGLLLSKPESVAETYQAICVI